MLIADLNHSRDSDAREAPASSAFMSHTLSWQIRISEMRFWPERTRLIQLNLHHGIFCHAHFLKLHRTLKIKPGVSFYDPSGSWHRFC